MSDRKHARYAPSSLYRAELCPGSVRACADIPEIESDYARDGTEAHALFSFALNNNMRRADEALPFYTGSWVYRFDNEKERLESVQTALDDVYETLDQYDDPILRTETRVYSPSSVAPSDVWGTADVIIVSPKARRMHIKDFKHGSGVGVSVIQNPQMKTYASGALDSLTFHGDAVTLRDLTDTIETTIVQPRFFSEEGVIRSWTYTRDEIEILWRTELDIIILRCEEPNAPLIPGEKQCKFCPAKITCPAREAAALAVVHSTFSSVKDVTREGLPKPSEMPIDKMSYVLHAKPLLLEWLKDVENVAYDYVRGGGFIPGMKLVESYGRREWFGLDYEIAGKLLQLINSSDIDLVYPRKLINITDAEKLVKQAFKEAAPRGKKKIAAEQATEAMALLTLKNAGKSIQLVTDSDPRPPANRAQIDFHQVKLPEDMK